MKDENPILVRLIWGTVCLFANLFPFKEVLDFKRSVQGAAAWSGVDLP
jgi:hypothetical protein